ncbi:MAG: L,D-transpeptidase, partial [Candidatus Woesearchaeota archaeon]|nr:L,D-transpeptidase [Candidatus Woesearchaeota archaeon]
KKTQKLTLFRNAEWVKVAEYDVSTGRNFGNKMINGDNKTPETPYTNGNNYKPYFTITSINDSSRWNFENISGAYGPWFMRLDCGTWSGANYSPGGQSPIGIHGVPDLSIYNPDFKDKIGTPASHGCIRMNNGDLSEIRYLVSVGTPVFIIGDDPYHQQIASQNTSLNTPVSYPPANNNHHNSSVRPTPTSSAVSTSHNIPNASMYDPKTANAIPGNTVTIPRIHGVQESNIKYESTTASGNPKPEIPASAGTIAGDTANNAL